MTKQTKKQKPSFDVADIAVVGGGLTGFAMALSAAHHGVTVSLIDRAPKGQKGDETRSTTINPKSYQHLSDLGVIADFEAKAHVLIPICEIRVSDEKTRPQPGLARPDELITWSNDQHDTPLGYVFRNAEMMAVMQDLVHSHPQITCFNDITVTDFSPNTPIMVMRRQRFTPTQVM